MKKIITMKHHVHDYECMWNGIEDLYMEKSGEILPERFFFLLSSFGSFCYLHTDSLDTKRMVMLGDGRTGKMYEFMAPIVTFKYKHYSYENLDSLLKTLIKEINDGYPVILGAMDMYFLPYFKDIYQKEHIPFHYLLANGYDTDDKLIYVYDGAREEQIVLSFDTLKLALDCVSPGLSKKNTICKIRMGEIRNIYEISKLALAKKAEAFLNPPTNFLGIRGMEKLSKEIGNWDNELGAEETNKILKNMLMFFGTVPTLPNKLKGIDEKDKVVFKGNYDKLSLLMEELGRKYADKKYLDSAPYFHVCAKSVGEVSDLITRRLLSNVANTDSLVPLFDDIKTNLRKAFEILS